MNKRLMLILLFSINNAFANLQSDMQHFFSKLGYENNITNPKAYRGQKAGLYTGGSLFLRAGVRRQPIATLQLPSYRAGCGGIDIYNGAFSFINGKALESTMRNIANNAESFAFELAMESISPLITEQMKHLQDVISKVNLQNINSCETAAALVGAMWPKKDVAEQHVCQMIGHSHGLFTDWAAAKLQCGTGGQRQEVLNKGKSQLEFSPLIVSNSNLAWENLKSHSIFDSDKQLKEFFMTLTGTIIFKENDKMKENNQLKFFPSKVGHELIYSLLYGGEAEIYQCDETVNCLNPKLAYTKIASTDALQNKIKRLMMRIVEHIRSDTPLNNPEKNLLRLTSIPIYKILNVQTAYRQSSDLLDVGTYSDVIAIDLVHQYLFEILRLMKNSGEAMQWDKTVIKNFVKQINRAQSVIEKIHQNNIKRLEQTLRLISMSQVMEQQLAARLSTRIGLQ